MDGWGGCQEENDGDDEVNRALFFCQFFSLFRQPIRNNNFFPEFTITLT